MKERPILFSAPMVRAILEGRKTQTRRVVKLENHHIINNITMRDGEWYYDTGNKCYFKINCPYGKVGDRIWVRETFGLNEGSTKTEREFYYRADHVGCNSFSSIDLKTGETVQVNKWKPSIHMPRKESRIDLEITGVRVERLNDISEQDAIAEGVNQEMILNAVTQLDDPLPKHAFVGGFKWLWESINGAGSWQQNPWVWVVSFRRVEK
jgi:hypothetical protein